MAKKTAKQPESREFRLGRTIVGSSSVLRDDNQNGLAERARLKRRRMHLRILGGGGFLLLASLALLAYGYFSSRIAAREAERLQAEMTRLEVPEVDIIDENDNGGKISARALRFVSYLAEDLAEYSLEIDHVILPFRKAREVDVYIKGRNEHYWLLLDRGSGVQAEDVKRMVKYLDEQQIECSYVDLRTEGRAFYR